MKYHVIPTTCHLPGIVPPPERILYHNEVVINVVDDVIYRNVNGTIIKYVREQEK